MVFCGAARRILSNEESGYTRPRPLGGGNPALPPEALRAAASLSGSNGGFCLQSASQGSAE